jgi:hypothetical protein
MDRGMRKIVLIAAALILLCLAACAIAGFLTYQAAQSAISLNVTNLRWDLDDCGPGTTGSIRLFGTIMNITVQGRTTYRTRDVCHSNGTAVADGEPYYVDLYRIDSENDCIVMRTPEGQLAGEECDGNWPGYVDEG